MALARCTNVHHNATMGTANTDPLRLDRLRDYYARHGALPSYAGISTIVGFRTKTAAVKLAQRLTSGGYLRPAPGGRLAPAARFFELPRVDAPVQAGAPETIEARIQAELVTLDDFLIDVPSRTVLIRVKGDSMRDAGVLDGDLAVVERVESAHSGQFVIAVVDGEFTLKELRFEGHRPVLVPHNVKYSPIHPTESLMIYGVVRGIVRRYPACGSPAQRLSTGAAA